MVVVSSELALMSESEPGSGLKRELGLALPPPKNSNHNNPILEYSRKRFKKSLPNHQSKEDSLNDQPIPLSILTPTNMNTPNPTFDCPVEDPSRAVVASNLLISATPTTNAAKPARRFTRSSLVSNQLSLAPCAGNATLAPREIVVSLRASTAIDGISGLHESSTKRSRNCSVRSTQSTVRCASKETQKDALGKCTSSDKECEMELQPVNTTNDVYKIPRIGDGKNEFSRDLGTETGNHIVTDDRNGENYESANKSQRRFTRSSLQCTTQPLIIKGTMKGQNALDSNLAKMMVTENGQLRKSRGNQKDVQDASSVKPLRQCTPLTLKCLTEPHGIDEVSKEHYALALLETPPRRFTRSALGCKEKSDMMHEDSKGQNTSLDVICPVKTPHKKLEMKMSKKIALTKFPTTISELLETGKLEGLSVTYISQTQKNGGLRGLIKDCEILCFCTLCKGRKVVTSSEFKRHAGGSNRNFADCLYLDNGNTFRHVLNVCKDAPLDMLEATIQLAIKSPVKSVVCLNCKRPLPARRSLVLCNSCLELKKSDTGTVSVTRPVSRSRTPANPSKLADLSKVMSPQNKSTGGRLTRKDLRLHKLVFEKDGLPDGTELGYYVRGKKLLEGYKKGFGIFCFCCNSEISPSQFEAHAGWATRRKPYLHIYTSNGVSLHELSVSLSKGRELSAKDNDDLCGICADFGDLLLCDGCPRAFHKDCVGQRCIPSGKWYCPYCQNVHKDQSFANNANALAAGRVSGVDPIEQISKRCIRIVKTPETEIGGCTLCGIPGFSKSGFGPRTIILCDQCEKEFHVGCLRDHNMVDLKELPKGKWFCCRDCNRINCELQKCVIRGPEELPDSITKLIKLKPEEPSSNIDISWRLLNGKLASPESRSLLSKAVAIFHNCFDPIVDAVTGRDLIPCMVYGRNIREQDFGGMFCAVLTLNSAVVSAGLLRIFGQEFAELPLVATSSDYQGQGYFQSLFSCIERLLGYLNVKHLVLPAAEEAEAIWTKKFGFQRLSHDQMAKYTKEYQMTIFRETPMLRKLVPKCRIRRKPSEHS